jgi:hypothetical protein
MAVSPIAAAPPVATAAVHHAHLQLQLLMRLLLLRRLFPWLLNPQKLLLS